MAITLLTRQYHEATKKYNVITSHSEMSLARLTQVEFHQQIYGLLLKNIGLFRRSREIESNKRRSRAEMGLGSVVITGITSIT